jgi:predicted transcriptional regulator
LDAYLELRVAGCHIKEGLRQADAGEFVPEARAAEVFAQWRR